MITVAGDDYPTLPRVPRWSPQERNSRHDHSRYQLESAGWWWQVIEGPDTLRRYGLQETPPEEIVATLE